MSGSTLAAFWAVSLLFVITPGADWAYAIAAGIRGRGIVPAVIGLLAGHLMLTMMVAAGVGAMIAANPLLMVILTVAGALYLGRLGWSVLRDPPVPQVQEGEAEAEADWTGWALRGTCVSGLNPKVFLLFLTLLPQFTTAHGHWPVPVQILALGTVHLISCALVYLLVGFGARQMLAARPTAARAVGRVSGIVMLLIAALLLLRQFSQ